MTPPFRPPLDRRLDLPAYRLRPLGMVAGLVLGGVILGMIRVWYMTSLWGWEASIKAMPVFLLLGIAGFVIVALPIWAIAHFWVSRHAVMALLIGVIWAVMTPGFFPYLPFVKIASALIFWRLTYRRHSVEIDRTVFE